MDIEYDREHVRTLVALEKLLARIESGDRARPDWITLLGKADLSRLPNDELASFVERVYPLALRGFEAENLDLEVDATESKKKRLKFLGPWEGSKERFLEFWCTISQRGFHNWGDGAWMKCYDAPTPENYDYITPYLEGGIGALDPYLVYSSVLGTWEYSIEDFRNTEVCQGVETVVEPLAGSAEFCFGGHFRHPEMKYVMFDLDEQAKAHVDARAWRPETEREFIIGNALDEDVWKQVRKHSRGTSLAYIGKQSQNFFKAKELLKLMEYGTTYCDHLMLEVSEPYLLDGEPEVDDLTRAEMLSAGFRTVLEDDDEALPNPLTNHMSFRLITRDKHEQRILFEYLDWVGWQAHALNGFARLLDLEVRYFHSGEAEFLPIGEDFEDSDCQENNTFILLTRP